MNVNPELSKEQFLFEMQIRGILRKDIWMLFDGDINKSKKQIPIKKDSEKPKINYSFSRCDDDLDDINSDKFSKVFNFIQDFQDFLQHCEAKDNRDRGNPFIDGSLIVAS